MHKPNTVNAEMLPIEHQNASVCVCVCVWCVKV